LHFIHLQIEWNPCQGGSLCPLSSTEFVEPPPPTRKKFLSTPLALVDRWTVDLAVSATKLAEVILLLQTQGLKRYRQGSEWEGARIHNCENKKQPTVTVKQVGHVRPFHPMFYLGMSYRI
jgi:hypothetical protein